MPVPEIAEAIGRHLNLPARSLPAEEFGGMLVPLLSTDVPASSTITQEPPPVRNRWAHSAVALLSTRATRAVRSGTSSQVPGTDQRPTSAATHQTEVE